MAETTTIDSTAASSTAVAEPQVIPEAHEGFDEFQAEQRLSKSKSVDPAKGPEASPASEPGNGEASSARTTAQPKQNQGLTDEEKSAQKKANDSRRMTEFIRQLGAQEREIARLKAENASKGNSATQTVNQSSDPDEPQPNDPKYSGENGWRAFLRDDAAYTAKKQYAELRRQEREEERARTYDEQKATIRSKFDNYADANPDFMTAVAAVAETLDTVLPDVSQAIADDPHAPELLHYLGRNPEVLDQIVEARSNPRRALMILGRVSSQFDGDHAMNTVSETKTPKAPLKTPVDLTGRGRTPTGEELLDKAAADDDFTSFRNAYYAGKKRR